MLKTKIDLNKLRALKLTKDVDALCTPLKNQVGLLFFNYIQSNKKGWRFTLSSEEIWFKSYFELEHHEYEIMNHAQNIPDGYANISLWDGCSDEHDSCRIYTTLQNELGVGYILFMYAFYQDFAESFAFGFDRNISHSSQVILKNLDVFKRFTQYFKDKGQKYIQQAKEQSFQVIPNKKKYSNPIFWGMADEQKGELFHEFSIDKVYLKNEYADIYFTVPEAKTVLLVIRGYTYDEIAKELHVSVKTIDYRMNQIRHKMNVRHKKDVIDKLVKGHFVELLEISI